MTTLFEEADNTNPPSPSLELLETPLKSDIESKPEVPSEDVSSSSKSFVSFILPFELVQTR